VSERFSPLSQRVRRLIGSGSLVLAPADNPEPARPAPSPTSSLFEARIALLSHMLDELRTVDLQREDELRALREQIRHARQRARRELLAALAPALGEIDVLLQRGQSLLAPPPEPPATLFERMRAGAPPRPDPQQREQVAAIVARLAVVRAQLAALGEE